MNWYLDVFKKSGDFNGRSRRMEYWIFTLFNIIIFIAATIADNMFGTDNIFGIESIFGTEYDDIEYGLFYILYALTIIKPGIAVSVRRLHDIGKSGWMILIAFIPFVGPIWLTVLFATEGFRGENQYGPDPKGI